MARLLIQSVKMQPLVVENAIVACEDWAENTVALRASRALLPQGLKSFAKLCEDSPDAVAAAGDVIVRLVRIDDAQ